MVRVVELSEACSARLIGHANTHPTLPVTGVLFGTSLDHPLAACAPLTHHHFVSSLPLETGLSAACGALHPLLPLAVYHIPSELHAPPRPSSQMRALATAVSRVNGNSAVCPVLMPELGRDVGVEGVAALVALDTEVRGKVVGPEVDVKDWDDLLEFPSTKWL